MTLTFSHDSDKNKTAYYYNGNLILVAGNRIHSVNSATQIIQKYNLKSVISLHDSPKIIELFKYFKHLNTKTHFLTENFTCPNMVPILKQITNYIKSKKYPIYISCGEGIGRTGAFIAIFLSIFNIDLKKQPNAYCKNPFIEIDKYIAFQIKFKTCFTSQIVVNEKKNLLDALKKEFPKNKKNAVKNNVINNNTTLSNISCFSINEENENENEKN